VICQIHHDRNGCRGTRRAPHSVLSPRGEHVPGEISGNTQVTSGKLENQGVVELQFRTKVRDMTTPTLDLARSVATDTVEMERMAARLEASPD
jgi:hypothetical protein